MLADKKPLSSLLREHATWDYYVFEKTYYTDGIGIRYLKNYHQHHPSLPPTYEPHFVKNSFTETRLDSKKYSSSKILERDTKYQQNVLHFFFNQTIYPAADIQNFLKM